MMGAVYRAAPLALIDLAQGSEYTRSNFIAYLAIMSRLSIELPSHFPFSTTLTVGIGDINYGGHMGNDAVLRLAHEARLRFLKSLGHTEMDVHGCGIIMSDAAVVYRAEAFHGDELAVSVAVADFNKYGCDLLYAMVRKGDGTEIARVKTGIVFFDYQARKVTRAPAAFVSRFQPTTDTDGERHEGLPTE